MACNKKLHTIIKTLMGRRVNYPAKWVRDPRMNKLIVNS